MCKIFFIEYRSAPHREVKIRSGEWFLEERAKKYPAEPGLFHCVCSVHQAIIHYPHPSINIAAWTLDLRSGIGIAPAIEHFTSDLEVVGSNLPRYDKLVKSVFTDQILTA